MPRSSLVRSPDSLWRNRRFATLLVSHVLAVFADTSVTLFFAVWSRDLTGSTAAAGVTFAAFVLPSLLGPLGGVLIDRVPHRLVMAAANAITALGVLILLLVHSDRQAWLVPAVSALYGFMYVIFMGARTGLAVSAVQTEQLALANSVFRTSREVLRLSAPLAGLGIYAAFGAKVTILIVAGSLVASGLCSFAVPGVPRADHEARPAPTLRFMLAGLTGIRQTAAIRRAVSALCVSLIVAGFYEIALLDVLHHFGRPAAQIGVFSTFQGVGAVCSGLLVSRGIAAFSANVTASAGFILQAFGLALAFVIPRLGTVYASAFLLGAGLTLIMVSMDVIVQSNTPLNLQGRTNTTVEAVTSVPYALSFIAASLVLHLIGFRLTFLLMAVVTAASCLPLLLGRTAIPAGTEDSQAAATSPPAPALGIPTTST